jgi:hypothetical protein
MPAPTYKSSRATSSRLSDVNRTDQGPVPARIGHRGVWRIQAEYTHSSSPTPAPPDPKKERSTVKHGVQFCLTVAPTPVRERDFEFPDP